MRTTFRDTPESFPEIVALARAAIAELTTGETLNREDTATACLHATLLKYFPGNGEKLQKAATPINWMELAEKLGYRFPQSELSVIHQEIDQRIQAVALASYSLEDGGRIPDDDGGPTLYLCRAIETMDASA